MGPSRIVAVTWGRKMSTCSVCVPLHADLIVFIAFWRIADFKNVILWNLVGACGKGSGCPLDSLSAGVDFAICRSLRADVIAALKTLFVHVGHIA